MSTTLTKEQIEDLIEYCGSNPTVWKGDEMSFCCPVHGETHPSCGVNSELQQFHCFACGAGGSLSRMLYMSLPDEFGYDNSTPDTERMTWGRADRSAREFMRDRYSLEYKVLGENSKTLNIKRWDEVNSPASMSDKRVALPLWKIAPFHSGKKTYGYFFDRGFTEDDMKKFMIGYDDVSRTVTIPVFYEDRVLAGVIGRYIDKGRKKNERYKIYGGFNRSKLLYPVDKYEDIGGTVILVEGQFDAIRMHSLGYRNTLSSMTDHLSSAQCTWITEHCDVVIYIGDNDKRGLEAREKNYEKLKGGVMFLSVDYPDHGKDVCNWSEEEILYMVTHAHLYGLSSIRRVED